MPVIMKENVQYAYTDPGIKAHTLSYAEYQALSTEEKMNGDLYFIPDKQPEGNPSLIWDKLGTATLDTDADNVSDAINELESDKVSKSGDTMTGDLSFDAKEIKLLHTDVDASASDNDISSNIYRYVAFYDKNDKFTGWYGNDVFTDGRICTELGTRNYTSDGSNVNNTLTLTAYKDGTRSVTVSDPSIWRTAINAVGKSGDTITGSLTMKSTNIDASKANNNVSATQYPTTFSILDNANRILTRQEGVIESNGNISSYWYVRNYNTSGGQVAQKGIKMTINKSGTLTYDVSDNDKFRSALGLGAAATHGVYDKSSVGHFDWDTHKTQLVTNAAIAFWNGRYNSGSSNLQYCDRGRFGTIVTKNSGDYPTTTTLPSGYRVRAGSVVKVVNAPAGANFTVFTQAQLNSLTGLTKRGPGNTVVWITNGDIGAAAANMTRQGFYGNDYTCTFSVAYGNQNFRFNYIIIAW